MNAAANVLSTFLHVRPDGEIQPLPVTDTFWQQLAEGQMPALDQGYLLSAFSFAENWSSWECHPAGDEWVFLLSGEARLILDLPNGPARISLRQPGEFAVVPKGIWHTAQTDTATIFLFLTPGSGTEHRPTEA